MYPNDLVAILTHNLTDAVCLHFTGAAQKYCASIYLLLLLTLLSLYNFFVKMNL